jgi:hypothetical protein
MKLNRPIRVKHLSLAPPLGRLLALPTYHKLGQKWMNILAYCKNSVKVL